jgi:hypothetical protein
MLDDDENPNYSISICEKDEEAYFSNFYSYQFPNVKNHL